MKYAFLILTFCLSRAFSQVVSPPDLRCLQVLPNGDVILTWVPPGDPGGVFSAYEIYNSAFQAGPFSLVATVPAPISTYSFTHVGAQANIQSRYYFMRSKYGSGGSSSSPDSDTLRTIFLNLNPGNGSQGYLKLSYNNLHQPPLASSVGSFSILKDYPIGTWNTFATTSSLSYNDTLSVCQVSLGYQVTLLDVSGCMSTSNIQSGIYTDTKAPDQPFIDSISVLPNGQVILAWEIPHDMDIDKYRIYQNIVTPTLTTVQIIDTVPGRNNTAYTFTSTGSNFEIISLYVAALDSCNLIGTFDSLPKTMYLRSKYNSCNYTTELSWNAYRNMPGGLLEYRVYYSSDGSSFSMIGTTTDTRFIHSNVAADKNVCYFVRAFNTGRNITSSSNRSCFFSRQVQVPAFIYIRSASILPDKTAMLKLYVDTAKACQGFDLYRSDDGVDFKSIGFIASANIHNYAFTDADVSPATQSYYYKALIKDSCGNERTVSNVCKTILLKVVEDKELIFTKHLSWNPYVGFAGGVSGYNIYRVINNNSSAPELIASTGLYGTTYTDELEDEAPNGSDINYVVEAVEGISNPYGFMEKSTSNMKPVYMEGRIFIPEAFAPNGINKVWLPITYFVDKREYNVKVFSRWGDMIFHTSDDKVGWGGDGAAPGVYAYQISYKNARGEYQELTGTLLLLE